MSDCVCLHKKRVEAVALRSCLCRKCIKYLACFVGYMIRRDSIKNGFHQPMVSQVVQPARILTIHRVVSNRPVEIQVILRRVFAGEAEGCGTLVAEVH